MEESKSLLSTIEVKPYPGHGGKREGAGRPNKELSERKIKKAEQLVRKLNAAVKLGLDPLLDAYPDLIEAAIKKAKEGDVKLLQFLIALPLKMATLDDFKSDNLGNSIIKEALSGRTVNVQINNVERVPQPVVDASWRYTDEGADDGDDEHGGEGSDLGR